MEQAKDMFDRVIKVGDICVYPVRRGSHMWMNRLTVQNISLTYTGAIKVEGLRGDGYPISITSIDRLAIIGRNNIIPFAE